MKIFLQNKGTGFFSDLAFDNNKTIYIADRNTFRAGVRKFAISTLTETAFIETGLPPYSLEIIQAP